LGLTLDASRRNQLIVYVHCTGFASEGPYAAAAYDDLIQGLSWDGEPSAAGSMGNAGAGDSCRMAIC